MALLQTIPVVALIIWRRLKFEEALQVLKKGVLRHLCSIGVCCCLLHPHRQEISISSGTSGIVQYLYLLIVVSFKSSLMCVMVVRLKVNKPGHAISVCNV